MQTDENSLELNQQSLSVLTPDCLKSFLEKIDSSQDSQVESRKANLTHTLKNIKNHVINTPSVIQAESLLIILEILRETFLAASSESVYYKIAEICFLIDSNLQDSQLDPHNSALNLMLEFSNHSFFFNTLLLCIENYYKKIAALDNFSQAETMENLTVSFYSTSIEILIHKTASRYQQCKSFLYTNLESFKAVFFTYLQDRSIFTQKRMERIFSLVLSLLKLFINEPEMNSFSSIFTISVLSEITGDWDSYLGFSSILVEFLLDTVTKDNYNEILCLSPLFSEPFIVSLSNSEFQRSWFLLWDLAYKTIPKPEIFDSVSQVFSKVLNRIYQQGLNIFLRKCEGRYKDVIEVVNKPEFIVEILKKIEKRITNPQSVEIYSDTVELVAKHLDSQTFRILLSEKLMGNEVCQKKIAKVFKESLNKGTESQIDEFLLFIQNTQSVVSVKFLMGCLADKSNKELTEKLLAKNLSEVLIKVLEKGFESEKNNEIVGLWQVFFSIFYICDTEKQVFSYQLTERIVSVLRNSKYDLIRQSVIEGCIETLEKILTCKTSKKKKFLLISFDFVSYPYNSLKIDAFRGKIFERVKYSRLGYDKTDLVLSIVIFHLRHQIDNEVHLKLLKKGLSLNASPGNVVSLLSHTLGADQKKTEKLLGIIKDSLSPVQKSLKFWHFPGTGSEIYTFKDSIKLSNKLTLCIRLSPSKNKQDQALRDMQESVILDLQGDQSFSLTLKLLNKKVSIHLKLNDTELLLQNELEISHKPLNFIAVSILGGKKSIVSLLVNGKIARKFVDNLKLVTKIKKISVGGSLGLSHFFSGKFSALAVVKEFLYEDNLQLLNLTFYFDLTYELRSMKDKVVFLLSGKQKSMVKTLEPEKRQSYCFIGKTLEKNIKYASCILFSLISKELTGTSLNTLLKIFILLCRSEEHPTKSLIKSVFSYSKPQTSNCAKYFKLVLSIKDLKLRKECFQLLLLNDFSFPLPQKSLKPFLTGYKETFSFGSFNFVMLKNLSKKMTETEICENFSVFTQWLCEHNTTAEVVATLAQLKEFQLVEGLLNVLINVDFKDCPETLFKVFLQILVFPQLNNSFTLVCIIIFNYFLKASNEIHWNTFKKDSNKTRAQELDKYLNCLKERVFEVESILNAVLYLASKNVHFTEKSNILNLFDIVLSQVSSINSDSIPKFFKFLQLFVRFFHSAILNSQYFLTSFASLSNCFHVKAGEILVYICSELKKFKAFNKIVEFFRNVKHKSYSFHIFASLFSVLHRKIEEDSLLLAEVMTILSFFSVDKENSEAYCEIVIKFAGILESDPKKLKFTAVYYESDTKINENCVGNIFLTIAFQVFHSIPSILFENCKKLVNLPEVDFFSKLKLEKVNEDYSILFCFIKISSLIIQGSQVFSAFLERFKAKTRVLDRIEEFIHNLSTENIEKFYFSPSINQQGSVHFIYDKEKSYELIRKAKQEQLSEIIVTEDWVQNIHILLQSFVITPFDVLLSTPKEVVSKSNLKKSRASSLDYSSILAIHGKQESFLVKSEYLKHLVRKEKKSQKFEFFESVEKKTFFVDNFLDSLLRTSKVKLKKKPESEYEMRRRQYKTSIIRSRSTVDFTSVVFTEQANSSVLPEIRESLCRSDSFCAEVEEITVQGSFFGRLLINGGILQVKFEGCLKPANSGGALEFTMRKKSSTLILYSREISEILPRKFIHRKTAIEIFTHNGKSYFINFFQESIQSSAISTLKKWKNFHICEDPTDILQNLRKKWIEGQISNFYYLMLLNKYSGRSFKDISQYPVFPWVLTNFSSAKLDLNNPENFRNFSYPIAAQTLEQRKELSQRVRYKNASTFDDHQNGSHYSNGGIVLYYLFRIEPFSQQAILLHDGGFDNADRVFYSMDACWKSCISLNDSKELVPELFYFSEVMENLNGVDGGKNHLGKNSADFVLPLWAKNSWDFVRKHRKALESGICSKELHKWIDLVFGYKQRGALARESFNLFMRVTYDDLFQEDKKSIQDNIEGITDQIYHFGQTPSQIFTQAHPKKKQRQQDPYFTFQKQFESKVLQSSKFEVQQLLITDDFLLIFYKSDSNISFTRHKIGKKFSEKGKNILLKGIIAKNSSNIKFCLWKSYIVSSGYLDYKIRIHDLLGEFLTLINTSSIQPSAIMGKNKLYYADFNIVISIKDSWKLDQKYYGHLEQINSVTVSESYSIICSLSDKGNVFIHDLKSAEIIYKFWTRFRSIYATEYGALVGFWRGGYSLVDMRGNCISLVEIKDFEDFVVSKNGEWVLYSDGNAVVCKDLLDDSEKVVRDCGASVIVLSESNRVAACISGGTKLFLYIAED